MKLSIAMCTYNGSSFIRQQLDSIAAQTRLPDELVICDDLSSDTTIDIIESFTSKAAFPIRVYINERNVGSTKNFEKAIELCEGDIIALADQDDVWRPEKLARIEDAFSSSTVGFCFSDADVVDDSLQPLGYRLWQSIRFTSSQQSMVSRGHAFEVLLADNVVTGATMAFRTKFRELVLPIPEQIDWLHDGWIAVMIAAVADVVMIREPLISYRRHSRQQTGAESPTAWLTYMLAYIRKLTARARKEGTNMFVPVVNRQEHIRARLLKHSPEFDHARNMIQLESCIAHLRARATMPDRRLRRLPIVLRELVSSRYHTFSKGFYSVARDLCL